jgi:hypothetical protein
MAGFELWEIESRNFVADFDTEAAALDAVARGIREHGPAYVETLVLIRVGPRGGLTRLAAGRQLADRIQATCAPRARASA